MYCADRLYLDGKRIMGTLKIPDGVTKIPPYAFKDCDGITSVIVPNSITDIGIYAFNGCGAIKDIYISELKAWCNIKFARTDYECISNPMYYADNLYINNTLTSDIVIPNDVESINNYAFIRCSGLTSVIIPDGVTSIGSSAFSDCRNLTNVTIGNGVTNIDDCAFMDCYSLNNIKMGNGIKSIGHNAFYCTPRVAPGGSAGNPSGGNNNIPAENLYISDITKWCNVTFADASANPMGITNHLYIDNKPITNIVIPSQVMRINSYTFYRCNSLKSIAISKNTTEIEKGAFQYCSNLATVEYGGNQWNSMYIGLDNESLKNATIHYNSSLAPTPAPTPIPVTTAEVTKEETDTTYTFTVTPEAAYENCSVYAAIYDENGILLAVNRVPLEMTDSTSVSVDKQENGTTAKVFVWSGFIQSIIEYAKEFPLIE